MISAIRRPEIYGISELEDGFIGDEMFTRGSKSKIRDAPGKPHVFVGLMKWPKLIGNGNAK